MGLAGRAKGRVGCQEDLRERESAWAGERAGVGGCVRGPSENNISGSVTSGGDAKNI